MQKEEKIGGTGFYFQLTNSLCVCVLKVYNGTFVKTTDLLNCSLTLFVGSFVDLHMLFLGPQTQFYFKSDLVFNTFFNVK